MILSSWATGLFFILVVTIIWTGASYLTEYIYIDLEFKSPFLLTYFSSSFFVIYLPLWHLWVLLGWVQNPPSRRVSTVNGTDDDKKINDSNVLSDSWRSSSSSVIGDGMIYNILEQNSHENDDQRNNINHNYSRNNLNKVDGSQPGKTLSRSLDFLKEAISLVAIPRISTKIELSPSPTATEILKTDHPVELSSTGIITALNPNLISSTNSIEQKDYKSESSSVTDLLDSGDNLKISCDISKYSHTDILSIAIILCPLWFLANCSYNYALLYTSVGSSTIISNLSGGFTLFFSWLYGVEKVTIGKILGLLVCFIGVIMVGLADTDSENEGASYRSLGGDLMAVVGAAGYGMYTTMLRLKVAEDGSVSMQLLLGYLGLVSAIILSPILLFMVSLDLGDVREITWTAFGFILLSGVFDNVISDYLWARSVLLTSPTVATVGLTLTIPMAIFIDYFIKASDVNGLLLIGAAFVFIGFLVVNIDFK